MFKLILITIVLISFAFVGLGIRLILDKKSAGITGSCSANKINGGSGSCGCGEGHCTS